MTTDFELTPIAVDTTNEVIFSEGLILAADESRGGNRKTSLENAKYYRPDGTCGGFVTVQPCL